MRAFLKCVYNGLFSSFLLGVAPKVALCVALKRRAALVLPACAWTTWAPRALVTCRLPFFRFLLLREVCMLIVPVVACLPKAKVRQRAKNYCQRAENSFQSEKNIKNNSRHGIRTRDLPIPSLPPSGLPFCFASLCFALLCFAFTPNLEVLKTHFALLCFALLRLF